ncbi:T-cell antigen CD7 isoform X2 [Chamaea fasciata]|uniref:T-cell antigen CD7 isoform X2 n=1 Tax=Chamaea fasciata TaxID=190680 RepID=UPI00336AD4AD
MLWMLCLPNTSLFLLLLPCFPAQNGGGNEQSTDVISAWEGDSINITCPMNGSRNQVGMYLKTIRQNLKVVNFPKKEPPKINPEFANRTEYSEEGENYRITLHRLQQSDSAIYQCSEIAVINGRHAKIYGKTTIVVVKGVAIPPLNKAEFSGALEQSPPYANPEQGQSVSITCVLRSSPKDEEFYLLRTNLQPARVLSVSHLNESKVSPAFGNRLEYSREGNRIVITLHDLQEKDSDNYICAEQVEGSPLLSGNGTMVLVKGEQACEKSFWDLYALLTVVALLFCALVCCTLRRVDMKKYFQKKKPNVVYEDMSFNSRRSTLVRSNTYSRGE